MNLMLENTKVNYLKNTNYILGVFYMIKKLNNGELDLTLLEVKDVIDIKLLQTFQDNFATGMNIASISADKNGSPVTNPSGFTNFCMDLTRSTKIGAQRCELCDKSGGEESARTGKPSVYTCHAGLVDFAAPILVDGYQIGSIIGGQTLTSPPDEVKIRKTANDIGRDEESYMNNLN